MPYHKKPYFCTTQHSQQQSRQGADETECRRKQRSVSENGLGDKESFRVLLVARIKVTLIAHEGTTKAGRRAPVLVFNGTDNGTGPSFSFLATQERHCASIHSRRWRQWVVQKVAWKALVVDDEEARQPHAVPQERGPAGRVAMHGNAGSPPAHGGFVAAAAAAAELIKKTAARRPQRMTRDFVDWIASATSKRRRACRGTYSFRCLTGI